GSGDHIDVLSVAGNVGFLDLRDHEGFTFAIGFDNARAALIRSLQWLQVDEDAERLFDTVEVAVSMTGAAGPWQVVGEWSLGGPATNVDIELAKPVWARYVRLSAPKRDGERYYYPPHKVAVNEA